jgi:hypothetical protein
MQIKDQEKSFATKESNAYKMYENRKVYKDKTLMTYEQHGHGDSYILDAFADFWYDRFLYGKVNRAGDIIIPREDFLSPLQNKKNKTFFALDFVAVAFNDFRSHFEEFTRSNRIPNQKTLFASVEPAAAWQSVYDVYHEYMSFVYKMFFNHILAVRGPDKINNFDEFANEFYIFCRDVVTGSANGPITLSGFVTNSTTDTKCGGLTIDLFMARASNDILKSNLFLKDVNFNFYVDAVNKHGFVIDKNIPWRMHANLSSDYMRLLMNSEAFEVKYKLGEDHIFDTYYIKTYTMDLVLLRKYMYDMYDSMVASVPFYTKTLYCNDTQKSKKIPFSRKVLGSQEKEKTYNVKNYWLDKAFRFRLLELENDLLEVDIVKYVKDTQSIYDIRGEMKALQYLHNQTKKFFIHNCNKVRKKIQIGAPKHSQ